MKNIKKVEQQEKKYTNDEKHNAIYEQKDYTSILNQIRSIMIIIVIILSLIFITMIVLFKDNTENKKVNNDIVESVDYDVSIFNQLTSQSMIDTASKSGYQVFYIGRSSCGFCVKFLPVLKEAQEKFGIKINYLDITKVIDFAANKISDQAGYDKIVALDPFFKEFGTTPMVAIFKDGKFVKGTVGYTEYDTFEKFMTENGLKLK